MSESPKAVKTEHPGAAFEQAEPLIKEKAWDKAFEKDIYERWRKKSYPFDKHGKGKVFSIDTPPPYVNTPIHMGHAATYSLMDMFARYHRMKGDRVLFPLGLDNNGLPIEMAAEKKYKVRLHELKREEAITLCRKMLEEAGMTSMDSFLRLGIGFNSWTLGSGLGEIYETDSPDYRALTQETFIEMWEKGLIYEDNRANNFDTALQTTVADAEVVYEDLPSNFNDIIFTCKETGERLIIGTTRPELVCACGMVIYNPEDERYQHLAGKTAITPIHKKEVPIRAHPSAEKDKGTGLVMMCSFGDLTDVRFFREQGIAPIFAIGLDGRMNDKAGPLQGLKVKVAREKMIELLKEADLLAGQKQILHRTPMSERSRTAIEFIAMPELYVKQMDAKDTMRTIAKDLTFHEEKSRQILLDWIENVSIDWPITRRRYYATEVPLWYCKKCKAPVLGPRGKYVQPWKDAAPITVCPKCKHTEFEGDVRVLDTWFDSSISPLYVLKWHRDNEFFNSVKRATLRPQGKEIVRTWLYYTLLKCYELTGDRIFDNAWIHYHIVDESGEKMSKSKGNVIDPQLLLAKYGGEPIRLWATVEGNLVSTDLRCSEQRIDGAGKTLTKLWNAVRFSSGFPRAHAPATLEPLDLWIRSELSKIVAYADERYAAYDFHNPTLRVRTFLWDTFASHYLELVKARAYNRDGTFTKTEQDSALSTIHHCVDTLLLLLAPVVPFITAKLYDSLHGKDVHFEKFPLTEKVAAPSFTSEQIAELNSLVWKTKKDAGKSLREPLALLTIPASLQSIEKELAIMHGAQKIAVGEKAAVELA